MPDIAGNSSTTTSIGVGGTVTSTLETAGDHDWVKINLTAGQTVSISLDGVGLEDPLLQIWNSAGTMLASNDDIKDGAIRDSFLTFTASAAGTYYLDAGAYNDAYAGTYQLRVYNQSAKPIATINEMAKELTTFGWAGDSPHHFHVTQGATLTFNVSSLTDEGKNYARIALGLWSDVTGIKFAEVTTGGQITFSNDQSGAATDGVYANGITTSANVNISAQWLTDYRGHGIDNYAMQTFIHEIGHALGLGHGGIYNGSAVYSTDASFANDGWPLTIMSYFDQSENSYFAARGDSVQYVMTPMLADIAAIQKFYGIVTTTRLGDTTYGFNSTADRDVFNATLYPEAVYTVVDSGGVDTLDYSGFGGAQKIDLRQVTFSNVGGYADNVCIARGTVIENAMGGSSGDKIYGNPANNVIHGNNGDDRIVGDYGNDTLYGDAGNDVIYGGAGNNVLYGGSGMDYMIGGNGNDVLVGGTSRDFLIGGGGADKFVFADGDLAGMSSSTADRIHDFSSAQGDVIDLSGMDANVNVAGDQAFSFIGTSNFHHVAGELNYRVLNGNSYVFGDTNGDGAADFWIRVDGTHTFTGGDFFL